MPRIPEGTIIVDEGLHTVVVRMSRKDWDNRSGMWAVLRALLRTVVQAGQGPSTGSVLGAQIREPPRGGDPDVELEGTVVQRPGRAAGAAARNRGPRMSGRASARGRGRRR
jgi:hypothetical protein